MKEIKTPHKRDGFAGERMIVLPTEAFEEYVRHPLVRRLYLTDIGYFPQARGHYRARPEGTDAYIYFYCMEGHGTIELLDEKKKYALGENDCFVIPYGCPHVYYAADDGPWSLLWVHFKGEDAAYYPLEERRARHISSEYANNRIYFLFDLLFRVLDSHYTLGNFIYITQVLETVLAETFYREKHGSVSAQNRNVTSIVRYMQKHLGEPLTMEQLEKEFGYSKSYISSIFQTYTKHAPMNFFTSLKMTEACKLLRATNLLVAEIAAQLGYSDPYYFSRIFKKTIGLSPANYRNHDYYGATAAK